MKRIFSVRTNIDTLAASVGLLLTDNEKALWLQGYIYALQGGELREGLPAPMLAGWTVGNESWSEARDHQLKSSAGGKKSIAEHPENRVDKHPRSDPPPYVPPSPPSDSPLEQSLIVNPVIFNPKNEKTKEEGEALFSANEIIEKDRATAASPMPPQFDPKKTFGDFRSMHGSIFVTRDEREDWLSLYAIWGWDPLDDGYKTLMEKKKKSSAKQTIYLTELTEWVNQNYHMEDK